MNSVIAIIPARGGSKRLPGKNIRLIAGKPMIAWTIEAAQKSKLFAHIVVSTDDPKIFQIAENYDAKPPFIRPSELAQDDTPSAKVVIHCLNWLRDQKNIKPDHFVLLQPTSPLRRHDHIIEAMKLYETTRSKRLISLRPFHVGANTIVKVGKGGLLKKCPELSSVDYKKVGILNGAIYINEVTSFIKKPIFEVDSAQGYFMEAGDSIDIDTEDDFTRAEILLKQRI
jgi:CMP-N,N'-diacetyllegionaminic acid synthase